MRVKTGSTHRAYTNCPDHIPSPMTRTSDMNLKEKLKNPSVLFWTLGLIWFGIDILQAIFTEIHADEAYYALYGQHLAWGYYDHPPMVGLFCWLSSIFFEGNLGIRFFTCLLHLGTLFLCWKLLNADRSTKGTLLFFALSSTLVMFNCYGFTATPDAPLLFFTAAFFLSLRLYLENPQWKQALWMGVLMAAMIYSKYHGVLVIGFVVLANPKLLADKRFWTAGILAIILLIPHLMWQIQADFPSFKYHLVQRNQAYSPSFTLEYFPNQMVTFNPISFLLALWFCISYRKPISPIDRTYRISFAGFILFFAIMTFKGHAEPHWTIAATIPLLGMLQNNILGRTRYEKFTFRVILPTLLLILVARFLLISGNMPGKLNYKGGKEYSEALHEVAGDTPVIFTGSFQKVSLYRFYTESPSVLLSSVYSRRTQFDMLHLEKDLQGKPAFILSDGYTPGNEYLARGYHFTGFFVDQLQTTNSISVSIEKLQRKSDTIYLQMEWSNPYPEKFVLSHPELPVTPVVAMLSPEGVHLEDLTLIRGKDTLAAGETTHMEAFFVLPQEITDETSDNKEDTRSDHKATISNKKTIKAVVCLRNRINTSVNSEAFLLER